MENKVLIRVPFDEAGSAPVAKRPGLEVSSSEAGAQTTPSAPGVRVYLFPAKWAHGAGIRSSREQCPGHKAGE